MGLQLRVEDDAFGIEVHFTQQALLHEEVQRVVDRGPGDGRKGLRDRVPHAIGRGMIGGLQDVVGDGEAVRRGTDPVPCENLSKIV
jgi:hypothetical protein